MSNSNFNLSFKDNNFKNDKKKDEEKKKEETVESDWIEVIEKQNSNFTKTNKIFTAPFKAG